MFECDVCGREGERYTITFPDGQMTLDRCDRHDKKVVTLREEKGSWVSKPAGARSSFKVSSPDEIQRQITERKR